MKYIIRSKTYGLYYSKYMLGIKHFSRDIDEAIRYNLKKEANLALRVFRHKDNYEIIKVPK